MEFRRLLAFFSVIGLFLSCKADDHSLDTQLFHKIVLIIYFAYLMLFICLAKEK